MGDVVGYASQVMLVTGLQGSGKTLSTIVRVKEWAEGTKRPVYYHGITDLSPALGWSQLDDPNRWFDVPDGSIVIIDECQKYEFDRGWKPLKGSAAGAIPPAVAEMATLRHRGINLVLITQGAMLLNANVRRLCGLHFHVVRTFGMQRANVYEWHKVQTDPESAAAKRDGILHVWKYPPWAFKLYKSAEVHTIKRKIPMKVKLLLLLPFVLIGLGWFGYQKIIVDKLGGNKQIAKITGSDPVKAAPSSSTTASAGGREHVKTRAEWLEERTPRIVGLAMTSPVYDDVTKPTIAPKPVACASMGAKCTCYSQQGTKLSEVPVATCRSIVDNGYFDDSPDKNVNQASGREYFERQNKSGELLAARAEPSRIGADGPPDADRSVARGRAYVEPRQSVTAPVNKR